MLMIRDIRKREVISPLTDSFTVASVLDVAGRPELFLYMEHYSSRESF